MNDAHKPHLIDVYEHLVGATNLHGLRLYHKFIFDSSANVISAYPSSMNTLEYKNVKQWTVADFKVNAHSDSLFQPLIPSPHQKRGALYSEAQKKQTKAKKKQVEVEEEPTTAISQQSGKRLSSQLVTDEYSLQVDVDAAFAAELQKEYDAQDNFEKEVQDIENNRQVSSASVLILRFLVILALYRNPLVRGKNLL